MTAAGQPRCARTKYKGWEAICLSNGSVELFLVPQVGGRIMGLRVHGRDIFFTHPGLEGRVEDISAFPDPRAAKRRLGFLLWGGDKTWLAPQNRWTEGVPFLDLDSGAYQASIHESRAEGIKVSMLSPVCRETGMQLLRTVSLLPGRNEWRIVHNIYNHTAHPVEWGLWGVTMLRRPGVVFLPRSPASPYPEGIKTFAEEGRSVALRPSVVSALNGMAVVYCLDAAKFKFGTDSTQRWILGVVSDAQQNLLGFRKSVGSVPPGPFAHGCTVEVFNSSEYPYFEMEIHGPLVRLQPQQVFTLEERQSVFPLDVFPAGEDQVRLHV